MDVDAVLLSDIYELLRAPPLSRHDVIISRNSDASQSLNCGFVYFNVGASRGRQNRGQDQTAYDQLLYGILHTSPKNSFQNLSI